MAEDQKVAGSQSLNSSVMNFVISMILTTGLGDQKKIEEKLIISFL
jgi:hypothetical protein